MLCNVISLFSEDGVINAYEGYEVFLTLSGMGLTNYTQVYLVSAALERGENCHAQHFAGSPGIFNVTVPEVGQDNVATMHIPPNTLELEGTFYMCVKDNAETEGESMSHHSSYSASHLIHMCISF